MHFYEVFQAIYNRHPYEYIVIDRELQIVDCSHKVSKYCEVDCSQLSKSSLFEAVPELFGMQDEIVKIFDGALESFTLPTIAKDQKLYIDLTLCGGKFSTQSPNCYESVIILFEDVTQKTMLYQNSMQDRNEKVLLARELEEKNSQLRHFNENMHLLVQEEIAKNQENQKIIKLQARHAQMGELIGIITHQWKQPLNIINIACSYLQMKHSLGQLEDTVFENKINNILKQTNHLNQTIMDFQNFFNPSDVKKRFNVMNVLEQVLDLVKNAYRLKNIAVTLEGDAAIELTGYANEYSQAILSLLQNSRDAFLEKPQQDKEMKIEIEILKQGTNVLSIIRDNAGGIPLEILPRIFDAYVTTKKEGSGLGLRIVKTIIEEKMQGVIMVKNTKEGVVFTLTIPQPIDETKEKY